MTISVSPIPRIVPFGTPGFTLTTANAAGSSASTVRADASLLAFDATVPTTQASADSAAAGSASVAARRDHLHGEPVILSTIAADTSPTLGGNLEGGEFDLLDLGQIAIGVGATRGAATFTVNVTAADNYNIISTASGAGPAISATYRANSPSPAAADVVFRDYFLAFVTGGSERAIGQMDCILQDPTLASIDSSFAWKVSNNVNTGNANTTATLTSLGVWTDSSDAAAKAYEGTPLTVWGGRPGRTVLDKILLLGNMGRYHSADLPPGKAISERHISPTAQAFHAQFGVGSDPNLPIVNQDGEETGAPGLAAKDVAGVALLAIQELVGLLAQQETRIAELETFIN